MAVRSLTAGLFAGLFLAFFLQLFVPLQLPIQGAGTGTGTTAHPGSTSPLVSFDNMAQALRNTLQIARQAARGAGGYKSARVAASSALQRSATSPSPSISSSSSTSARPLSTTATMASKLSFLDAVKNRRTIYALNKNPPISDKQIVDIVKQAVLHVPSSFNSQSARLVVLLNAEHDKFWDFVLEILKPMVPAEQLPSTEGRIAGFKAGYGTILFFEDPEPVQGLQKAFPIYAHHFPDWSEHTSAMHQFALWVALEAEGLGANLQHYNPIIDRKAQETWNIPSDWKLRAQLVFGGKAADAGEKEFKPVEGTRLFVHGAKE